MSGFGKEVNSTKPKYKTCGNKSVFDIDFFPLRLKRTCMVQWFNSRSSQANKFPNWTDGIVHTLRSRKTNHQINK